MHLSTIIEISFISDLVKVTTKVFATHTYMTCTFSLKSRGDKHAWAESALRIEEVQITST